eukprot:scaffold651949_cov45-Prasinocladus_malaysianus.AAC.1
MAASGAPIRKRITAFPALPRPRAEGLRHGLATRCAKLRVGVIGVVDGRQASEGVSATCNKASQAVYG